MKVNQGDVIEVNVKLPEGDFKPHPCIVISNNDINHNENMFVCVMISSTSTQDDYTYNLKPEMFLKELKKKSQIRTQIVNSFGYNDIIKYNISRIKQNYLEKIIDKIYQDVLNVE